MTKPAGLVVMSHKPCVIDSQGRVFAGGGWPAQMRALARRFGGATILVPCRRLENTEGLTRVDVDGIDIVRLSPVRGRGLVRKLLFPLWCLGNARHYVGWLRKARGVHAIIPGDVGTIGMLGAWLLRRPLLIRHCGNWLRPRPGAECFWKAFMERFARGRTRGFATGGGPNPPSNANPEVAWIFSTSLTRAELDACRTRSRQPRSPVGRLVFVGRQEPHKGTDVVLDALASLVAQGRELRLTVVGDGSRLPDLRRQAAALGLEDRVGFVGRVAQADVLRHLAEADLFVYPTTASEGFPKVVLEALALGRPILTTRVSVLPHLLAKGGGVILEEATPEALAGALEGLLDDPARVARLSAEALDLSKAFSLEAWADVMYEAMERARRATGTPLATVRPKPHG